MTTVQRDHIDEELLAFHARPPSPVTEPDVGTVNPFTSDELAAIAAYNERMRGVADCFDIVMHFGPDGYARVLREHQEEDSFAAAVAIISGDFGALCQWYAALDQLHSDAADYSTMSGSPSHSNAVDRLLRWEAHHLVTAADRLRQAVTHWLIGDGGPAAELGALATSNGRISLDGWG